MRSTQGYILDVIVLTSTSAGEVDAGDETSWNVAIQGSLSLFEGGGRRADVLQAEKNLAAERIEQLIRSELHQARASFAAIRSGMASKVTFRFEPSDDVDRIFVRRIQDGQQVRLLASAGA